MSVQAADGPILLLFFLLASLAGTLYSGAWSFRERFGFMRWFLIIAATILVLIFALAGGAWVKRNALAERAVIDALEKRGLDGIDLTINEIGEDRVIVSDISAGRGETRSRIGKVVLTAPLQDLISGKIQAVEISGADIHIRQQGDVIDIAGIPLTTLIGSGNEGNGGGALMPDLFLKDTRIRADTDYGKIALAGDAELAGETLKFDGDFSGATLAIEGLTLRDYAGTLALDSPAGRALSATLTLKSDVLYGGETYRDAGIKAVAEMDGDWTSLADWPSRDITSDITLALPEISLDPWQPYTDYLAILTDRPAARAALEATGQARWSGGTLTLRATDPNVARLQFDNDVRFSLGSLDPDPVLVFSEDGFALSTSYGIEAPHHAPRGRLQLSRNGDAPLNIDFYTETNAWKTASVSLLPTKAGFRGRLDGPALDGTVSLTGGISRLRTENSLMEGLSASGITLPLSANLEKRDIIIAAPGRCLSLAKPRVTLPAGEISFADARFCPVAGKRFAKLALDETGTIRTAFKGKLSASQFRASFEETLVTGAPPGILIDLDTADDDAVYRASLSGGRLQLNDDVALSDFTGKLGGRYADGVLALDLSLPQLLFEDLTRPVRVAPLIFAGDIRLQDQDASFEGDLFVRPEAGAPNLVGTASGGHNLDTASGGAMITLGPLAFTSTGVQPTEVVPALKGFVEDATGGAGGQLVVNWSADGLNASGQFALDGFSFNGPVTAITRTAGVALDARLINLMPVQTNGRQEAAIALIDMDALKLENGEIEYEAPGDDTLRIYRAEWPWFGGRLGVYDANVPLDGSTATIPMRVDNLDIAQLFSFLDIKGLSGTGKLSGSLPIVFSDGSARIENGIVRTVEGGVLRYEDPSISQAAGSYGPAGELAFDTLTNFSFTDFSAEINGDLAGDISMKILMEGTNDEVIEGKGVIYRVNIDAPMTALFRQLQAADAEKDRILNELSGRVGVGLAVEDAKENQE